MLNDPTQLIPSAPATPPTPAAPQSPAPASAVNGSAAPDVAVVTQGRTVEDVEAEWRNRFSMRDRLHNVAEQALRDQNETLQKRLEALTNGAPDGAGQAGSPGEASGLNPVVAEQLRVAGERAAQAEQRALVAERRAKYPSLAAQVHESILLANDEASLAKLNAAFDEPAGTYIAPTSPRRSAPAASKPLAEQSKDELLAQLEKVAPKTR